MQGTAGVLLLAATCSHGTLVQLLCMQGSRKAQRPEMLATAQCYLRMLHVDAETNQWELW